jgi:3-phenylpropionate/trans-cinnamate dioxygenase ferredoxin reductase component
MATKHYPYLIIGGGMTAAAAAEGIGEIDSSAGIGIIGAERDRPYNRPPLTKALWKGELLDSIWRDVAERVQLHLGHQIRKIAPQKKQVLDDAGETFGFDVLLLATGGQPRRLSFTGEDFIYYRTLPDYRRLREMTQGAEHFAVIGGGFIGSEIAAALVMNGKRVTMIFPGENVGSSIFPEELAAFVSNYYRKKGVELIAHDKVIGARKVEKQYVLTNGSGREITADGVVVGIGIEPNVELAKTAGLEVDNGIVVNEFLQTSAAGIYAAGDVAAFQNPALGKRIRVEHEDNANSMGHLAGRNMAGANEPYNYLPFFYSDLFDLGYEAVGELDSRLETFADWKQPNKEGVIYYLKGGRVRGVLLWNVWEQVDAARRLIASSGPFTPENLKGRLPAS